jgi:hypothetical protein
MPIVLFVTLVDPQDYDTVLTWESHLGVRYWPVRRTLSCRTMNDSLHF